MQFLPSTLTCQIFLSLGRICCCRDIVKISLVPHTCHIQKTLFATDVPEMSSFLSHVSDLKQYRLFTNKSTNVCKTVHTQNLEGILIPSLPALGMADGLHQDLCQGSLSHSDLLWPGNYLPIPAHLDFELHSFLFQHTHLRHCKKISTYGPVRKNNNSWLGSKYYGGMVAQKEQWKDNKTIYIYEKNACSLRNKDENYKHTSY